ncbi:MAG: glutamine--tRNA ligase/YqeY domain fusion protein [Ardenticatenaceae bacterium]|nr:glutamine--tRNA ligase/YqeY domain fusion protein [Ardenticatenaceae bacterium]MCB8990605.1 glutamine--tRNA ligase/YqeY domain fusion protein [Ardenticatenaceae bacterium]MCB9004312.1 glutamine--tRNA ligase/YqeY domain fusion protein [Ardenticatenaceae bacterium]
MSETSTPSNFIRTLIDGHLADGRYDHVHTRFPPEPNGYLHIGHAKSILLNYGLAQAYGGQFNLRFDDTNPLKEEQEFIDAITADVKWLGGDWEDRLFYASDYFEQLYQWAIQLIKEGKAYVDDLTAEEIRQYRGTLTEPGQNSPYRDRSIEENLDLFERMKQGEFPDGSRVLRAKIDMAAPNMNFRDPVLYRILHAEHPRTGNEWCIYPMYDWAHGQSDSIEGITHSICTLEFEDHRPLYEWFIENLGIYAPQQIEFARLAITYTVMSKRKLRRLVEEGYVNGWDDPRMPTIRGLRRRGYTPETMRNFAETIGVSKANSIVDIELLEHVLRDDLNRRAPRAMGVLRPLKLTITNYPSDAIEEFEVPTHPQDKENDEMRVVPFSREIYIEQDDFMEEPPGKYYRLAPGREVRLLGTYYITCDEVLKDEAGNVLEVRCSYDPESRGGTTPDGRKVKGTIHWVSAAHALDAEVRVYDRLFTQPNPDNVADDEDFTVNLNPNSLEVLTHCKLEPNLETAQVGDSFQFMRQGYFVKDQDSTDGRPVFNLTVGLRDTWAKMQPK